MREDCSQQEMTYVDAIRSIKTESVEVEEHCTQLGLPARENSIFITKGLSQISVVEILITGIMNRTDAEMQEVILVVSILFCRFSACDET